MIWVEWERKQKVSTGEINFAGNNSTLCPSSEVCELVDVAVISGGSTVFEEIAEVVTEETHLKNDNTSS